MTEEDKYTLLLNSIIILLTEVVLIAVESHFLLMKSSIDCIGKGCVSEGLQSVVVLKSLSWKLLNAEFHPIGTSPSLKLLKIHNFLFSEIVWP